MNTKEILEMATEIQAIKTKIERLEGVMEKTWRISFNDGYNSKIWETTDKEVVEEIKKPLRKILVEERNKLHKMNDEPLEEIQEQKTNYEKFDTILKEINEDEYENYSSKAELMTAYLKDYKRIREMFADFNIEPNKNIYISEEIIKFIDNHNRLLEIEEKYMALEGEIMKFNNATESIRKS